MDNASRRIVGLMGFAVVFSVVGLEIKASQTDQTRAQAPGFLGPLPASKVAVPGLSSPAKIILGGTVAAALLALLAATGPSGEQIGLGLATVALATAALVNGGPVWTGLEHLFGSTPTGVTGTTKTTGTTASFNTTTTGGLA